MKCPTHTSTGGREVSAPSKPSGALSSRQIIALIQQKKWWPFDRVDGKLLTKMHKQHEKETTETVEEAPW